MSKIGPEGRSFARIERADLKRLLAIAQADLQSFFDRRPDWARQYERRLLAIALCQGAALHVLNGRRGVHDFDVWSFFVKHRGRLARTAQQARGLRGPKVREIS